MLNRTAPDLIGKCLVCWVTVVLWVRVALTRDLECHISEAALARLVWITAAVAWGPRRGCLYREGSAEDG